MEYTDDNGVSLGFLTQETAQQADPQWQVPTGQRMNLQFRCESAAEVDATYATLIAAGHPGYAAPWDAYWGQRFARVQDPDNNVVNFFAEL